MQKPSFVTIGTTGIKVRLMHDSDQYIYIDTVVVKGLTECKNLVNKSGRVPCRLLLNYLGYILMYGWSQSISEL